MDPPSRGAFPRDSGVLACAVLPPDACPHDAGIPRGETRGPDDRRDLNDPAGPEVVRVAQDEIPLTALVVDDDGYGMLRFDQKQSGDPLFGVDLKSPDFVTLARSFGIEAESVEGFGGEFVEALGRHIANGKPSMLVAHAALEPPPTTSPRWYRRGQR